MPAIRKPMCKIKDVLRLKYSANLSHRQIAAALKLSVGVISKYLSAAQLVGITCYPLPQQISDSELEETIFPTPSTENQQSQFALPDFPDLH
jgi:DNA-binding transcriptional regulator LsrR (DeoR family)